MKAIWETSSLRKAINLNKDEFYLALRCLSCIQSGKIAFKIGMKLDSFNILRLNKQEKLPQFVGVEYDFADDEFEEIQEDDSISNKQNGLKFLNSYVGLGNISNENGGQSIITPNKNNNSDVSSKKKLDDLFDLLNSDSSKQESNPNQNNLQINNITNNETYYNVTSSHNSLNNFQPINTFTCVTSQHPQQSSNNHEEDEFVDIEEDSSNMKNFELENKAISNPLSLSSNTYVLNSEINFNNQEKKLVIGVLDLPNSENTHNIQKKIAEPETESVNNKKQEIDFQNLILSKNNKNDIKIENINLNESDHNNRINNIKLKSTENTDLSKTQKNNQISLDDLLGDFNNFNDVNVIPVQENNIIKCDDLLTNTNSKLYDNCLSNTSIIRHDKDENSQPNFKIQTKEEDLDFCEVEEDNTDIKFIEENMQESQIEKKENHGISETHFNLNTKILNENIISAVNLGSNNNQFDSVLEHVVEQKNEIPKVSIINYTPDDFLNEFKRENKIPTNDDDFQFVVNLCLYRKKKFKMKIVLK